MLTRRAGLLLSLTVTVAGCGGSSSTDARPTASPSAQVALPSPSILVIDPEKALTRTYSTTVFKPALRLKLPTDWEIAERDESAFQIYAGADEEYELTFDHSYLKKETVAQAVGRLGSTE